MTDQRAAVESRISALRRDRGAAVLAGKKFDSRPIIEAEAELDGINDANAERVRREREASAEKLKRLQAERCAELTALHRDYLGNMKEAEDHARALAAAVARALSAGRRIATVTHRLSGAVPIPLAPGELTTRLACRLAAILGTVPGHQHRLGPLVWPSTHHKAGTNWRDAEAALLAGYCKHFIEGTGNDKT